MLKKLLATTLLTGSLFAASPANATDPVSEPAILLDLVNAPVQSQTFYVLPFVATTSTTFFALGGYQLPSYIYATQIALTEQGSNTNLLSQTFDFYAAPTDAKYGFYTQQYDDSAHGTGTNAVDFGSIIVGAYDYYTQNVATTIGQTYVVSFLYTQAYPGPNEFRAQVDEPLFEDPMPPVPEPATWAMMLSGLGLIGFAMRRVAGFRRHDLALG